MIYVFDSNTLSTILSFYYPYTFPSFWEKFNQMIYEIRIISVREAKHELEEKFSKESGKIAMLTEQNKDFFEDPNHEELRFITEIYSISHFQQNLEKKKRLKGGAFADPFIIAKALVKEGTVISEESYRKNGTGIPNICKHFDIPCMKLQNFFVKEKWEF